MHATESRGLILLRSRPVTKSMGVFDTIAFYHFEDFSCFFRGMVVLLKYM